MANNNEKMIVVKTSLIALTKWGKEKTDLYYQSCR